MKAASLQEVSLWTHQYRYTPLIIIMGVLLMLAVCLQHGSDLCAASVHSLKATASEKSSRRRSLTEASKISTLSPDISKQVRLHDEVTTYVLLIRPLLENEFV